MKFRGDEFNRCSDELWCDLGAEHVDLVKQME